MKGPAISRWLFALVGLLLLASCAPASQSAATPAIAGPRHTVTLFFSAEVWGGLPFAVAEKQRTLAVAVAGQSIERLERPIPYEISNDRVQVQRFLAIYEVDGQGAVPKLRSGYELRLSLPSDPPQQISLTNRATGFRYAVRLGN